MFEAIRVGEEVGFLLSTVFNDRELRGMEFLLSKIQGFIVGTD